jgi:hypothetical protein
MLLAACCGVQAQEAAPGAPSIDQGLTIVGRDETFLALIPPVEPAALPLPTPTATWPAEPAVLPITPPPGLLPRPLPVPDPQAALIDALTQ